MNEMKSANKEFYNKFIQHYATLKQLDKKSIDKYYYACKAFFKYLDEQGLTLDRIKEADMLALIKWLQEHNWSEQTKESYWDRFSRVYKWSFKRNEGWDKGAFTLVQGDEYGDGKFTFRLNKKRIEKKGIVTPEEVLKLLSKEHILGYKAFFSTLYESGMRKGEILSLKYCDVEETPHGYMLHMRSSKTIIRPVPIMEFAVPYLRKWLAQHPAKEANSYLWVNIKGQPLRGCAANKRLRELIELSGIERKKVTLHSFRHSRASELANAGLTEAQLCKLFGWRIGSRTPAIYIRESAIDTTKALRRAKGLEWIEEKPKPTGKICLQCQHQNELEAKYCDQCNLPLDRKELEKIKTNLEAVNMKQLLKNMLAEQKRALIKEVVAEISANKELV